MSDWKSTVWPPEPGARASVGLLLLRLYAGAALMGHGWAKIQNPMHWMDRAPDAPPGVLQALAAVAEFFGGLGLIVGLLTPLAAFGVACTMIVAVHKHVSHGDPFVAHGGPSFEPALGYLATAVLLMLGGPGRYALDAVAFRRR
ncbi:MAG: putative rane protein [Myxococcaceae bacterium]|nr:putative rane protein [Myxococcaceae bacterium]